MTPDEQLAALKAVNVQLAENEARMEQVNADLARMTAGLRPLVSDGARLLAVRDLATDEQLTDAERGRRLREMYRPLHEGDQPEESEVGPGNGSSFHKRGDTAACSSPRYVAPDDAGQQRRCEGPR